MLTKRAFVTPIPAYRSIKRRTSRIPHCAISRRTGVYSEDSSVAFVLSHFEARELLQLQRFAPADRRELVTGTFSVDLGKRKLDAVVVLPDGITLNKSNIETRVLATWDELKKMSKKGKTGAYEVFHDGKSQPKKIAGLSHETNRPASLLPVAPRKPPTLMLGGFGMHRMKNTDPEADTASKVAAIGPRHLRGHVLDICSGLGYTAIESAQQKAVTRVTTIEVDPVVVDVQRRNPWSEDLFTNPKIHRLIGNAVTTVVGFVDSSFDAIIHDPPAQALGGDLYGMSFYEELSRICVKGGKLFHYIGNPTSTEGGRLFRGVKDRLEKAGFRDVKQCSSAYGLTAIR